MAQCLAAKIELIAEFRGAKLTGRRSRREIGGSFNHLTYCCLKKEMIARHFVNLAETAKKFQQPADTKIGALTLENDFLEGALSKAGLLSAKR
jgi:hypothetical protein